MTEKYIILSDLHTKALWSITPYLVKSIENDCKIIIPGIDSDRADNLDLLKRLAESNPDKLIITSGNHEEGFVKSLYELYNIITTTNPAYQNNLLLMDMTNINWLETYFSQDNAEEILNIVKQETAKEQVNLEMLTYAFRINGKEDFSFTKTFKEIINSEAYKFIDDLVRQEEKNAANKEFTNIKMAGNKVMILHGAPVDFETDLSEGYNHFLWSGLTKGLRTDTKRIAKKEFDPVKAFIITDYLEKNNYKGLIRGHDHIPTLITRKRKENGSFVMKVRTPSGSFIYHFGRDENHVEQLSEIAIYEKKNMVIEENEIFIFSTGAFDNGFYAEAKTSSKNRLKFRVYHTEQNNAPHKRFESEFYKGLARELFE
ncbi:hypothetical protein DRJ25_00840 [Candidatus Woesearchaeota archaeon]|nr:MAG: hypothetical protein DRJ25_00840 [Candidatus Woesearchaeota archaeon]